MCVGRLRGYQHGQPDAFYSYHHDNDRSLDSPYVDGVSITYGTSPRKHLWTYAVGNVQTSASDVNCPCNNGAPPNRTPSFVGNDYYCESGSPGSSTADFLYSNDPVWDGEQCGSRESTCCTRNNMPWFLKTLDSNTTEEIEVRQLLNSRQTYDEKRSIGID